jgi:hypothetical protein
MPTAPAPTLTTAPAEGPRRWWAAIPRRLGRARTSTVVLALLFVALGVLYLYVRPETTGTAPAGDTGEVSVVPAPVTTPAPEPTTTAPSTGIRPTTSAPATTSPSRTVEEDEPVPTQTGETTEPEESAEGTPSSPSRTPTATRSPTGGSSSAPTT